MNITVSCVNKYNKRAYDVTVPQDGVVQDIRIVLASLTKNKLDSLLLFEGDEYLQHFVPLSEYEIKDGSSLIYEARLCGILPVNYDWSKSGVKTKFSRFAIQTTKQ